MIDQIQDQFQRRFQGRPLIIASPGRINLIGEHTDYNDGFVLPSAIDRRIYMAMAANGEEGRFRLYSADLDEYLEADLAGIRPQMEPRWANYILGVVAELIADGASLKGFDCVFAGDIPIGGGMSSSAALENATAVGLNHLFDLQIPPQPLLRASQRAEHRYAGVLCGIMDQFATMMSQVDHAIRLDCRTLAYEFVPLELGRYTLLLCDTNVSHTLAGSEYNTRRRECEESVSRLQTPFPQITALRDVTPAMLEAEKGRLTPLLYKRARHVVEENDRVGKAVDALKAGRLEELGRLLYLSHESLQHDYEVSCAELDFLVDFTRNKEYIPGARMMGGGFGGCTLNLIETERAGEFVPEAKEAYLNATGLEMKAYLVRTSDGARVVGR